MCEVRNLDGKLVCRFDKRKGMIEIKLKKCLTRIMLNRGGITKIVNTKTSTT